MKKLLIIQPHSDDALFSCSHTLFYPEEYEVQILTVETDKKRAEEDRRLFEFLQIPVYHLGVDFKDESFYGFHKKYKDLNDGITVEYLTGIFGEDKLNEVAGSLVKWVKNFLKKNKGYEIYIPWGIGHPFHFFVKMIIEENFDNGLISCYREFPHSYKKRSQVQVLQQAEEYPIKKEYSVEDFHDVKFELAKKFYRTQSGLLFFEQGYIKKRLPEEVYKKLLE